MNWKSLLRGADFSVAYDSPLFGVTDPPPAGMDLTLLKFSDGRAIEVKWDEDDEKYLIDLLDKNFRVHVTRTVADTSNQAVDAVRDLAFRPVPLQETESKSLLSDLLITGWQIVSTPWLSNQPPRTQQLLEENSRSTPWMNQQPVG